MAVPQGVNSLVGSFDARIADGATDNATALRGNFDSDNVVTDGTEFVVGAFVIGALVVLILFRLGGLQAVIAA
jgi:hypothetical protein